MTIASSAYIIMSSASRVGVFSMAIGFIVLVLSRWQQYKKRKLLLLLAVTALSLGVIFSNVGSAGNNFDRLEDKTTNTFSSSRVDIYRVSLDLFKKKPLFGHGLGSFDYVFSEQTGEYLQQYPDTPISQLDYVNHPHNELLFWAVEAGLISLIGLILFAGYMVWMLGRLGWSRGLAYSALLWPIVLHTQVELPFYLSSLHWFVFLILIYIVLNHKSELKKYKPSRYFKWTSHLMAATIFISGSLFMVDSWRSNNDITDFYIRNLGLEYKLNDAFLLNLPLNNAYYSRHAKKMIMMPWGLASITEHKEENVAAFTVWATQYLQNYPNYIVRAQLAISYHYLGEKEKMCNTISRGLFLHPKMPTFSDKAPIFSELKSQYNC